MHNAIDNIWLLQLYFNGFLIRHSVIKWLLDHSFDVKSMHLAVLEVNLAFVIILFHRNIYNFRSLSILSYPTLFHRFSLYSNFYLSLFQGGVGVIPTDTCYSFITSVSSREGTTFFPVEVLPINPF